MSAYHSAHAPPGNPPAAEPLDESIKSRYNATHDGVLPRELSSALASVAERHAGRLDAQLAKYLPSVAKYLPATYGLVMLIYYVSAQLRVGRVGVREVSGVRARMTLPCP